MIMPHNNATRNQTRRHADRAQVVHAPDLPLRVPQAEAEAQALRLLAAAIADQIWKEEIEEPDRAN
jgi:hypothetical protein